MRIVKHAIGVFCLLAALLLGVVWVRSHWVREGLRRAWYTDDGVYLTYHQKHLQTWPGQFTWATETETVDLRQYDDLRKPDQVKAQAREMIRAQQPETRLSYSRRITLSARGPWHGFEQEAVDSPAYSARIYAVPIWLPLLIFAAPGGLWLRGVLRRRRGAHECPNCGYDLRATPDRCPECGTLADTAA